MTKTLQLNKALLSVCECVALPAHARPAKPHTDKRASLFFMIMVPDSVLQSELLTPAEKLMFPQLVVFCGSDGITKAENDELAAYLNISERSCSGFVTNLNRGGFVTVEIDRKVKTNQRTIRLNKLTQDFALSPILLQKLMLADADSCVRLAQILASALPDAKSCVMLAQNLASTNKEQCADSESVTIVDANSCVNPGQNSGFSDKRDNIYNNNINYTTQENNINTTTSFAQKPESADLTQDFASTITVNGERIFPETLGQLLSLRGIEDDQVAPFVAAHAGRVYNDLNELRDLVRKWLKRTKPKAPKKSVAQRRLEFRDKLNEFNRQNPKKYPVDFYKGFFDYWTATNDKGTTMRFEKDNYFFSSLGNKLEYSHKNFYLKNQTYATPTNSRNGDKPHKQYGFVSASDLAGEPADAEAVTADSASESETETTGYGLTTVLISLE